MHAKIIKSHNAQVPKTTKDGAMKLREFLLRT